jgi:hypothetical protein
MNGPRAINAAEAVICPFWDTEFDELSKWTVEPGLEHGLSVYQFWCWTTFEWARPTANGEPVLTMCRDLDVDCTGYDALIISLMLPPDSSLEVEASTDAGVRSYVSSPAGMLKHEHTINLDGACRIDGILMKIREGDSGIRSGWLNWIGLQSTTAVPLYQRQWQCYNAEWTEYIKPADYVPEFKPSIGIVATVDELAKIRCDHDEYLKNNNESPFTRIADAIRDNEPEPSIGEYVGFFSSTRMTSDTRYNRERDHDKMLVTTGQKAAIAGVILGDPQLLRLAARYAMSLAMCTNWEDGMVNRFPGSTFDTRCFVQSLCLHDIAIILDLAGEMFTDLGREFLLRRISEEGLAVVNYDTWKYEYLFHCNQLAWFTPGRMLAYLVVEKTWPRAKPYTDICYRDLVESMSLSILPDGGYAEGPNYFQCVGRDACLSFFYYARARGLEFESIVPEIVGRTGSFGTALASTDESKDVLPICDAKSSFDQQAMAFLDFLIPGSAWGRMLEKSIEKSGMTDSLAGAILSSQRRKAIYSPEAFTELSELGLACSHRMIGDETVKLLILGNHAGASHTHEDKGSFILEFAGETFAIDPGTCDYSDPLSSILKGCERHNMLVPSGTAERPRPDNPISFDVKPDATGDSRRFEASINLATGWENYYHTWNRRFDSPSPDLLMITDTYALKRGEGVNFYWNTMLEVTAMTDGSVLITGNRGTVTLSASDGYTVAVEELPLPDGDIQRRIVFSARGLEGSLQVTAQLAVR